MPKLNLENWKHIFYAPTQKNKAKKSHFFFYTECIKFKDEEKSNQNTRSQKNLEEEI